jgi:hypothetical protein
MCSAGMFWTAVLIAGLLAGVRLVPTTVAVAVAVVLVVPGFIAGVIGHRLYYRTTGPRRPWSLTSWVPPHVPHWAAMLAGALFFGYWLAVVVAFAGLDGDTRLHDGQYVLDDNGRVAVVGPADYQRQADYERQADHEQQISLGVLGALAIGGTFLTAAVLTQDPARENARSGSAGG